MSEDIFLINRLAGKVCEYLDASILWIKESELVGGYVVQLGLGYGKCGFQISHDDLANIDTDFLALYIVNSIKQQMNP